MAMRGSGGEAEAGDRADRPGPAADHARCFLAGGLYLARFNWDVPLASDAERALYDAALLPRGRADARAGPTGSSSSPIMMRPCSSSASARRSTGRCWPGRCARSTRWTPRAIGIDILIDQAQPEDAELIAAFRAMRTPTYLAFGPTRPIPTRSNIGRSNSCAASFAAVRPGTGAADQHQDGARR